MSQSARLMPQIYETRPRYHGEMAAQLFVFLAVFGVFLSGCEAQDELGKLPEKYKKGVEISVEQINSHQTIKSLFLFFKSLDKSEMDGGFGVSYIYHRFNLKATRCPKGTSDPSPSKCAFRNDRPLIDCGTCYKLHDGMIQNDPKPYVHCVHKPQLTQDILKARLQRCSEMSYANGSPSLLAMKRPQ